MKWVNRTIQLCIVLTEKITVLHDFYILEFHKEFDSLTTYYFHPSSLMATLILIVHFINYNTVLLFTKLCTKCSTQTTTGGRAQ